MVAQCARRAWAQTIAIAVSLAVALPASAAGPGSDGPSDEEARERLSTAMEKFDAGDFEGAQDDFEASFNKEANPLSLWGWAQATNKVDGCRKSVKLYRQFSKMVDEGSPAYDVALQAISECAGRMAEEPPETVDDDPILEPMPDPEPDDSTPPPVSNEDKGPPPDRPWHRDPLGGVLVGVGAAGTATGIGLLAAAAADENNPCEDYECFEEQQARVERVRIAGVVVLAAGAGLLIGGVVRWAVVGARQKKSVAAAPILGPRVVGFSLSGRF